jgi:succinate dehydrogenase hydrophobic anchor subunit
MPAYAQAMAGAALALAFVRGLVHAAIAARVLPPDIAARLRVAFVLDTLFPFVPALLHAFGLAASIVVRAVRWAGIGYRMDGNRVAGVDR